MEWTWLLAANVLLVVFGATTAALAIFGETRRNNRITPLGWAALLCAVLTFGVGVTKEILTQRESSKQQTENEQQKGAIKELRSTVGDLRNDLKEANQALAKTGAQLEKEQLASQKTTESIQHYVYDKLSIATVTYVQVLSTMVAQASDGWVPSTRKELFSRNSVNLICRWLNAQGEAPVLPGRPWHRFFDEKSREYRDALAMILNAYATRLSPSVIDSISAVTRSEVLTLPSLLALVNANIDRQGRQGVPMVCFGSNHIENRIEKGFTELSRLVDQISAGEKKFRLEFRMDDKRLLGRLSTHRVGVNRLSVSAAQAYMDSLKR